MGKNAVMPFSWQDLFKEIKLKRQALFFDKVYISELNDKIKFGQGLTIPKNQLMQSQVRENLATIEYLIENKIIYDYTPKYVSEIDSIEAQPLIQKVENLNSSMNEIITEDPTFLDVNEFSKLVTIQKNLHDLRLRLDAIDLTSTLAEDFFPIVQSIGIVSEENRKTQIARFVLENIPEPDVSTSWEQIIEFRSDSNVRNKYLALINWINKVAASESTLSDIKDEYEYLYSDYIQSFNLHKMKYNNTLLEVIVTAGAGLLLGLQSGQLISPFQNLLRMKLSYVNLLQEESLIPGKEVAYIQRATEKFGK